MRKMPGWLVLASLCGVACGNVELDAPEPDASEELVQTSQALFVEGPKLLNIIAHQDDDIFAMTPDLANAVKVAVNTPGAHVRTVVLTAGENEQTGDDPIFHTCQKYIDDRGAGQRAGWNVMANTPNAKWVESDYVVPGTGKRTKLWTHPSQRLSIVYMGLSNDEQLHLEKLWGNTANTLSVPTRDEKIVPVQTYTRQTMIDTLEAMINDFAPTHLHMLDAGKTFPMTFPDEHTDHVHGALFTLAALQERSAPMPTLRMYRTYNAMQEVANVAQVDYDTKTAIHSAYMPYDGFLCQGAFTEICQGSPEGTRLIICNDPLNVVYEPFMARQYPVYMLNNVSGPIRVSSTQCLRATAGLNNPLTSGACLGAPSWEMRTDGTLKLPGTTWCASTTAGFPLRLATCNATLPAQHFVLSGWGQLRVNGAQCAVSPSAAGNITFAECANVPSQQGFYFQSSGDVQASSQFTVAQLPNNTQYTNSLSYGDLDNDGDDDVCVRRPDAVSGDGVWCAINNNGTFNPWTRWLNGMFGSAYNAASSGGTMQLVDLSKDGFADLCVRTDSGIECANNQQNSTFSALSVRGSAYDFWSGYGGDPTFYGTIAFADVNNDTFPDACARGTFGIQCALGIAWTGATPVANRGKFSASSLWIDNEFTNGLGWTAVDTGTTVQFADVDGDGWTDVCGRSLDGIICALNKKTGGFDRPHRWSDTGDFSNGEGWHTSAARYGSIRFADINGDGRADVCGRGATGVVCGLSMGQAFSRAVPLLPVDPFTDANGYNAVEYGSSVAMLKLNKDLRRDLCFRGKLANNAIGLRCTYAPTAPL